MKKLNRQLLQPADIILTTSIALQSRVIRAATKSEISHAMLAVNDASLIEANRATSVAEVRSLQ